MNLIKLYRQYRDKWWALPLVLPMLLLPVSRWANTAALLNGNDVSLYYLPLALVLSLMLFFGWAALPGIVLGLLLSITRGMTFEDTIGVIFHFLIPTVLCWGGYRSGKCCCPRAFFSPFPSWQSILVFIPERRG